MADENLNLAEVATRLRRLLDAIERGELSAPGPMIAHLQGALATVEMLAAREQDPGAGLSD